MFQKEWDLTKIEDRIQKRAIERRRPLSCIWELTYHCNFHCRMCYVRMTDEQAASFGRLRTVDEWLDMARQIYDAGVLYLTLTGGECTLYPGFERLYEQLYGMGFRLCIMSNAGAYKDSTRELFRRFPPHHVAITLYGGSNQTYAAVTGDPYGFDKVLENIRYFQSIGVPITLNFTVIRQNVLDYPVIGRLSQQLNVPYTITTDIAKHQRDPSFSDAAACRLSPAQRACVDCHSPENVVKALEDAQSLEMELQNFQMPPAPFGESPSHRTQKTLLNDCIGSYTGSAILWNGDMQCCISMGAYHHQKPFEIGFEKAWEQMKNEHEFIFQYPGMCKNCRLLSECQHNCPGRRVEGTKSPLEPDLYICQYAYLLKLYRSRINDQKI